MKRVRALAAVPAAVGLALPLTAQAHAGAATTPASGTKTRPVTGAKSVSSVPLGTPHLRNSGKKCAEYVCISVIGSSLYVATVHEWINHRTQFRYDVAQIWVTPIAGHYGEWLSRAESWSGTKEFTWHPDCSWTASRNAASAIAEWTRGQPRVSIWGGGYRGKPYCHYI